MITEVDGLAFADIIFHLNSLVLEWPELQPRHYKDGHWWLAYLEDKPVAFAGLVPFLPNIGYLKRCLVMPGHNGHGLQFRLMKARELKAKQLGWTHIVSDCREDNHYSAGNFLKAGFEQFEPEQLWEKNSIYWIKSL